MNKNYKYYKAIDWNSIEDEIDKSTWEKLTEQFWLDTRVPLSNDLDDWRKLSNAEKDLIGKVFGGLHFLILCNQKAVSRQLEVIVELNMKKRY